MSVKSHNLFEHISGNFAASTQRAESWHNRVKRVTNRHTPIEVYVRFIRDKVDQMVLDYENRINS